MSNWVSEDEKLAVLAKGARARIQGKTGAALRDETGRTYASAEVSIGAFKLSAIEMVVAQAVASGSTGIESVVFSVSDDSSVSDSDVEIIRDFAGAGIPIHAIDDTSNPVTTRLT